MSGFLAVLLGLAAVTYAVWPFVRGHDADPLPEPADAGRRQEAAQRAVAAAERWAALAGEAEPSSPQTWNES